MGDRVIRWRGKQQLRFEGAPVCLLWSEGRRTRSELDGLEGKDQRRHVELSPNQIGFIIRVKSCSRSVSTLRWWVHEISTLQGDRQV